MLVAVLSDIHANLEALDRVLRDAARCGATDFVCLGDVVGYGPLPQETLARIRRRCRIVLAGNHDDAVSGRGDASTFIDLAADAAGRHRAALDADSLAWLKSLPYTTVVGDALAVHGDAVDPPAFAYIDGPEPAAANFAATTVQLLFAGHTHVPGIYLTGRSGKVYGLPPQDFTLEDGKRYIVNPGSVGYPREANGRCLSSYVLYDTGARTISFRFLPFAVSSVMQRGRDPSRRTFPWPLVPLLALPILALAFLLLARDESPASAASAGPANAPTPAAADERPAVLRTIRLPLDGQAKAVRANLTLAKDSAPATLTLVFLGEGGRILGRQSETVMRKSTRKTAVPQDAVVAELSVTSLDAATAARIDTLAPVAE